MASSTVSTPLGPGPIPRLKPADTEMHAPRSARPGCSPRSRYLEVSAQSVKDHGAGHHQDQMGPPGSHGADESMEG